jgi:hypothetical protein
VAIKLAFVLMLLSSVGGVAGHCAIIVVTTLFYLNTICASHALEKNGFKNQ